MAGYYTTDLTALWDGDSFNTGTGTEFTNYTAGTFTLNNNDLFFQGTLAFTGIGTTKAGQLSLAWNRGSTIQINGGNVLTMWVFWGLPSGYDTFASTNGGLMICAGTAIGSFDSFRVNGSDTDPIGGWQMYCIDLRNTPTGPVASGSATETNSIFGATITQTASPSRGPSWAIDAIRYGRMTFQATGGTSTTISHTNPITTSTAANFPQMAYYDSWNTGAAPTINSVAIGPNPFGGYNRLGQLQETNGVYLARGVISLGTTTTSVYFNDANRVINFRDEFLTYNDFNRIEIRNASSTIIMDACSFSFIPRNSLISGTHAPATTRCNFEMFNNALVQIVGCTFTDMGTFTFLSGASGSYTNDCTFRRCQQVKPSGMPMTSNLFINSTDTTGQVLITSAAEMSAMSANTFETSQTAAPTIDLIRITGTYSSNSGSPTIFTFDGHTFTSANGFGTTPGIYAVNLAGTGHIQISPTNGCNITQSMVRVTGGGSVTVVPEQKTFTISNIQPNTEIRVFKTSDDTELFGIESVGTSGGGPISGTNCTASDDSVNTGRRKVTYTHASTDAIFIVAISYDYQFLRQNYTLSNTTNQEFLLSQIIDRNYDNPA